MRMTAQADISEMALSRNRVGRLGAVDVQERRSKLLNLQLG